MIESSSELESGVNLLTLVQMPATQLMRTVSFYVEVLGLSLEYPERPIESHTFLQTKPRIGPGLHILETPNSEFRHLHGTVNGKQEPFLAFYVKSLDQVNEKLLQAKADIVEMDPLDGYMSFYDPEGHLIGVYERTDSGINNQFESNITGFRHVQMNVADQGEAAAFFESALGFKNVLLNEDDIYMAVKSDEVNQPMIRLMQAVDPTNLQSMHWILDGRPKHALELHSKNIVAMKERVLENGGAVLEELEFNGCGGYLKFYTPDGHYIWINQDRSYCNY